MGFLATKQPTAYVVFHLVVIDLLSHEDGTMLVFCWLGK